MSKNSNIKKLAVLSISTVTGSATAIAKLSVQFPDQSLANIEGLVTVSSISALITILLNHWTSKNWE